METLSKLNLCRASGDANTVQSPDDVGQLPKNNEEEGNKNEQKAQKLFKKSSSPLATVKEEAQVVTDLNGHDISTLPKENGVATDPLHERNSIDQEETSMNSVEYMSSQILDLGLKDLSMSTDQDCENYQTEKNPPTSTPDKELFAPNPSIKSLITQAKESFELEEVRWPF